MFGAKVASILLTLMLQTIWLQPTQGTSDLKERRQPKTHTFHFTTSWKNVTFFEDDGRPRVKEMIAFNDQWPLPELHVTKGDRIELFLTNGFQDDTSTSLHFHGLFHNLELGGANQMDGPSMVTQCPIVPGQTYLYNFSLPDQVGTYWYHAHHGAQYGDGMRGALVIHDPDVPFQYDEDVTVSIADLYYKDYRDSEKEFLSRYNPTGAEPVPQHLLFNDQFQGEISFKPSKTYLLRFINMGLFVSQYIILEDHDFTIVEVDGAYVKPNVTNILYIAAGQRMSVLVHSKPNNKHTPPKNYALMQIMDETMLDVIPKNLKLNTTNAVIYDNSLPKPKPLYADDTKRYPWFQNIHKHATNDFYLKPLKGGKLLQGYDKQIVFDVKMENLGDGVNYAFFNNLTYVQPKVPFLTTILTSGKLAKDLRIYSDNTNAFILGRDEIIEIVLNNYDTGRHPFHIHGHKFQVVQKSPPFNETIDMNSDIPQEELTVPYDENHPMMDFPEAPILRDTVILEPNGHVVIRFKADNPGVWMFHCHVDWHLQQGLAAIMIEDPESLQSMESLSDNYKEICKAAGIPNVGNSAGHSDDWFNMDGLPRQPKPLPNGFIFKGYFAMFLCTAVGIWGLWSIVQYGLSEMIPNDEVVYNTLTAKLKENNIAYQ
ncbi:iron transport multicopper oxidase Fet5p [Monosporozyma unispora]|nr:ferroxidase fet3 [Kazachstania unispora]